jgi:hypothetical protein
MFSSYKGFKNQDFPLPLLAGEGLEMEGGKLLKRPLKSGQASEDVIPGSASALVLFE